jgi:hypothetical protein
VRRTDRAAGGVPERPSYAHNDMMAIALSLPEATGVELPHFLLFRPPCSARRFCSTGVSSTAVGSTEV